jgi:two-component system nitrate/nitrite response regulator NarL
MPARRRPVVDYGGLASGRATPRGGRAGRAGVRREDAVPIRVLLADDNALFREGMANLLTRCAGVEVVGQAKDTAEVVRRTALLRPDVVLMDLAMPLGGGVAATQQILSERPEQMVCILTMSEQDHDLFAAIRAGARGYLVKTVGLEELCTNLHLVAEGGSVVTPHLAARLLEEFATRTKGQREGPSEIEKLSPREREVLQLVARGASNKDLAGRLVIAENTVKVHLRNILDKLQLRNRQQAAAFAVQEGLVRDVRPDDAP